MQYRREVDGLRALAVLPVMLFHAGFEAFGGGFVGVDVFFVISGYLITSLITAELQRGRFSFTAFYERRARRILPALVLVTLVCLPLGWLWLLPSDLQDLSQSAVAVALMSSNVLFWLESGYFDTVAEYKPLLHTWSLAVEEQFYAVFPLLLVAIWRLGPRWVLGVLAALLVASLAWAQWAVTAAPAAAFFLLPSRCWELLVGACAALALSQARPAAVGRLWSELLGAAGLAAVLLAVFSFSPATPVPGLYALVPTVGAALVIVFATERTAVGRMLGAPALVGIGLVSYSAYLWHQPLFALARHRLEGAHHPGTFALLCILALGLAYLTWRWVEQPFRQPQRIGRPALWRFSLLGLGALGVLGLVGELNAGFRGRLPPNLVWQSFGEKLAASGPVCQPRPVPGFAGIRACRFGDRDARRALLVYGDSHAEALTGVLAAELSARRMAGIRASVDGCEVVPSSVEVPGHSAHQARACAQRFNTLLAYIRSVKADVVVSSRWSFKLYPLPGLVEDMPYRNSEGGVEREKYRAYAIGVDGALDFGAAAKQAALVALLDGLLSTGARVFTVYPVPEIAWDIAALNFRHHQQHGSILPSISIAHTDYVQRNRFVLGVLDSFQGRDGYVPVRPQQIFCHTFQPDRCVAQHQGVALYDDDDHVSDAGARLIVDRIVSALQAQPSAAPARN